MVEKGGRKLLRLGRGVDGGEHRHCLPQSECGLWEKQPEGA